MARLVALSLMITAAAAAAGAPPATVGDTYRITRDLETSQQFGDGGSGTSSDVDTLIETVVAVRSDGLEVRYDLPADASEADRQSTWHYPARIFRPWHGAPELLDETGIEKRIKGWLAAAKVPRSACGHWIFTWNAFQIDCDPQSILRDIAAFDLGPDGLAEGSSYDDPIASSPETVRVVSKGSSGKELAVTLPVDPDRVRGQLADQDVALGESAGRPVSRGSAVAAHRADRISGTIAITFDLDASGQINRRTKVTKLMITPVGEAAQTRTATEVLLRTRIPPQS